MDEALAKHLNIYRAAAAPVVRASTTVTMYDIDYNVVHLCWIPRRRSDDCLFLMMMMMTQRGWVPVRIQRRGGTRVALLD
eukprot:CAMPEP_0118922730 /NCGR_PEP_ID=MMETSP1169-20130426/1562_1 /TAXON_ID=36882 /ORGANISM="Pyramimonas obovata, Strain CCMP722" /LENGTH=79 /DNA_ID=CAMNT_0006863649 /DNA_START=1 /DNA_END=240 /DNA_ORIENTATION=-